MNYKNEKINITIENSEFFTIVEQEDCVELLVENKIK